MFSHIEQETFQNNLKFNPVPSAILLDKKTRKKYKLHYHKSINSSQSMVSK